MKKFWVWLTALFAGVGVFVKKYITPSVQLVQNFKTAIDSPAADLVTAIIPGTADDFVKEQMRKYLPVVLTDLKLTQACATAATSEEKIKAAQAFILTMPVKTDQQKAYQDIATKMAAYLIPDGHLDWGELSSLIVYAYKKLIGKA